MARDFLAVGTVAMTGAFDTDVGTFTSGVADGASAIAYDFDTANTLANATAKIASFKNNGVEKSFIDKDGKIDVNGKAQIDSAGTIHATTNIKFDGSGSLGGGQIWGWPNINLVSNGAIVANTAAGGIYIGGGYFRSAIQLLPPPPRTL